MFSFSLNLEVLHSGAYSQESAESKWKLLLLLPLSVLITVLVAAIVYPAVRLRKVQNGVQKQVSVKLDSDQAESRHARCNGLEDKTEQQYEEVNLELLSHHKEQQTPSLSRVETAINLPPSGHRNGQPDSDLTSNIGSPTERKYQSLSVSKPVKVYEGLDSSTRVVV